MYSPLIVDKTLHSYRKSGIPFTPRSVDSSIDIAAGLDALVKEDGTLKRPYTSDEEAFIRSETLLCRADFRYWATRYGYWELDASEGGGVAPAQFWPSQERALDLIAEREEEIWADFEKHGFSPGIMIAWHKTRQQGATGLARLISAHRMILFKNIRAIAASLDEAKRHELYVRDKVVLDNLPHFLRPKIEFDVKDQHLAFEILKGRITYQMAGQEAGVGTSQQFDMSHMTEVSLWPYGERLQFDFLPAVPKSPTTFVGWESTANGRGGFWYEFTESIRKKEYGFGEWIYSFTAWYINWTKNRLVAPDSWRPAENTQRHAELIERTSAEYAGKTVHPSRDQLYWWETQYELNRKLGTLHIFLSNYPATPEQSFQHSASSALPHDTLEWMRAGADLKKGMPYEVQWVQ